MLSPNTKLQDRYRIIRRLGFGGMGTVYEAIDERVSCIVTVKETLRGDKGAFKREAELLANLRHPSLPRVTDHFSVDEGSFLVMDFIPGNDLAELLELRGSPFPVDQVLDWADELLKVLEYLHRQGVLHRDIKPSNLKLMRTGEIFLLDFGLAKGAAGQMSTLTTNRSVLGYTLAYASLEQIHEHGTDMRSDLYSVGATLYHLLTGRRPIGAPTRDLAIDEEQPDPLIPVHELNPQVSPVISAVIQRAMAIRRKGRPESAAEMRRLLSDARRAAASLAEEENKKQRAFDERREREAEEEKRHAHEAEEARRRREAAAVAAPPMIQPAIAVVVPQQQEDLPLVGASDAPAQTGTLQTPPPPIFQPAYIQNASPVGEAPGTIWRSPGKSRWLLVAAAAAIALVLVVVFIVVRTMSGATDNKTAQTNVRESRPPNLNRPKATPSPLPSPAQSFTVSLNGVPLEMVLVPAGTFRMGSSEADVQEAVNDDKRYEMDANRESYMAETPQHEVKVQSFYIGKYEVTQAQWQAVMGNNPSTFKGCDQCPVEEVFWEDAQEFVRRLNTLGDGHTYRLPTESEWEYACRAGTTTPFAFGSSLSSEQANFDGSYPYGEAAKGISRQKTTTVGSFQPNAFGLYDMHGNVSEWCQDRYHKNYYGAPTDGSVWLKGAGQQYGVLRGGSWSSPAGDLRSAYRYGPINMSARSNSTRGGNESHHGGFRVAAVART